MDDCSVVTVKSIKGRSYSLLQSDANCFTTKHAFFLEVDTTGGGVGL